VFTNVKKGTRKVIFHGLTVPVATTSTNIWQSPEVLFMNLLDNWRLAD